MSLALDWLAELVAPLRCAACDELLRGRPLLFCAACAPTIEAAPSDAPAAFSYGGAIALAITRAKYGARPDLASRLGRTLASTERVALLAGAIDCIVPVPLHPLRLAARGYNQAALLARPLASVLRAPLAARALERTRDTPRQASLDRPRRLVNVVDAFGCRERNAIAGARVLLVDDVRTTGATLAACIDTLTVAGARRVTPLVVATA